MRTGVGRDEAGGGGGGESTISSSTTTTTSASFFSVSSAVFLPLPSIPIEVLILVLVLVVVLRSATVVVVRTLVSIGITQGLVTYPLVDHVTPVVPVQEGRIESMCLTRAAPATTPTNVPTISAPPSRRRYRR